MFSLVTGGMRSGKTYYLVKLALDAIAAGRDVCTDIPLNIKDCPHLHTWQWTALTDTFATEQERFERYPYLAKGGVLFLLDEGWKGLRSGDRSIGNNLQLMSFFREHGQFLNDKGVSNDIVLCTQNFKSLNSQIRELADVTVLCVKPTGIGVKNMTLNYHVDGAWSKLRPPRGSQKDLILKIDRLFLDPEVYKCYNSHAKTQTKDGINKGGFDKEGTFSQGQTVFHAWSFRFAVLFVLFCLWFVPHTAISFVQSQQKKPVGTQNDARSVTKSNDTTASTASNLSDTSRSSVDILQHTADTSEHSPSRLDTEKLPSTAKSINLSSVWRLASIITRKKDKELFIFAVDKKGHVKRINAKKCTKDDFEWQCTVDNELITQYSGSYSADKDTDKGLFSLAAK